MKRLSPSFKISSFMKFNEWYERNGSPAEVEISIKQHGQYIDLLPTSYLEHERRHIAISYKGSSLIVYNAKQK